MTNEDVITENKAYEMYNDMLDDCYGDVDIAGMQYQTSRALKELDPIAYRVGFNDFVDSLETDEGVTVEYND